MAEAEWVVPGSRESHDTVNPINQFLEVHLTEPIKKSTKELIQLGKGTVASYNSRERLIILSKLANMQASA